MRTLLIAAMLAIATAPVSMSSAVADDQPVSPSDFRAFAEGWTLYFERDGAPFGAESFEPGGKTVWRYSDGSCVRGVWRPYGAQVCFRYQTPQGAEGEVLCWRVLRKEDGGLRARLLGESANAGMEIDVTRRDKEPLLCTNGGTST